MAKKLINLSPEDQVIVSSDLSDIETALEVINGDGNYPQLNLFAITSPETSGGSFALNITKNVYRVNATVSNGVATIPTPDTSSVPVKSQYYYFELEVHVGSTATSMVGPSGWIWMADGELPTNFTLTNKTVYISARLDCSSGVRTVLANVWRIA